MSPGPSTAWNSPVTVPSHPEGAYGPGIQDQSSILNPDLSLEDSELIDVLWRADIDLEKGLSAVIPTPEQQQERDLELLSEKHWRRQFSWRSPEESNDLFDTFSKAYADLRTTEKEFMTRDPFSADTKEAKDPLPWNKLDSPPSEASKEPVLDPSLGEEDVEGMDAAKFLESFDKECEEKEPTSPWFNATTQTGQEWRDPLLDAMEWTGPTNDVCLASAAVPDELSPDLEHSRVEIGSVEGEWREGVGGGEWNEELPFPELDSIPTPDLDLSTTDITRLFADRQLVQDVVASVQTDPITPERIGGGGRLGRVQRRSRLPDQRVPTPSSFAVDDGASSVEVFVDSVDELDILLPNKELPTFRPFRARTTPTHGPPPSTSTAYTPSQDYAYGHNGSRDEWTMDEEGGAVGGLRRGEDEEDLRMAGTRFAGKLVPKDPEEEEEEVEEEARLTTYSFSTRVKGSVEGGGGGRKGRPGRQSKDDQLARQYSLPYSAQEIVDMPLNAYTNLIRSRALTPDQRQIMQKIRRRGKNKEAARNCRKRRVNDLEKLEMETDLLRQERDVETQTNLRLQEAIEREEADIQALEEELLRRKKHSSI